MIGESRAEEQLEKALTRAEKSIEKEIDADAKARADGSAPLIPALASNGSAAPGGWSW